MMTAVMVMTTARVSTAIVITEVDEMTAISGVTTATIAMTIVAATGVDMERTIYLHLQPGAIPMVLFSLPTERSTSSLVGRRSRKATVGNAS
jgi:hypothetical protein